MTTRELANDVSALCFYDIGERDKRLIAYANLALKTIYKELNLLGSHTIYRGFEIPASYSERVLHKGSDTDIIDLKGKAYSFIACGKGRISIFDGESFIEKNFDSEETSFRGFLKGEGKLTLSGENSFYIYSLSTFEQTASDEENDIPIVSERRTYDMKRLVTDFQSFILPPTDKNGREIKNAMFADSILSIPYYGCDRINIVYRRLPKRIYTDLPNSEIDLSGEYTDLLVALCAYFICLEDERTSAEQYKQLYNSLLVSHKSNSRERLGDARIVTNGWA